MMITKFIKFGIVGLSGFILDFGCTWICKEYFLFHPLLANAIGFSIAVSCNFLLNREWTFDNNSTNIGRQIVSFLCISLVGLLLNTTIIGLLNNIFSLHFYINKAIATLTVVFWNFFANSHITFPNNESK